MALTHAPEGPRLRRGGGAPPGTAARAHRLRAHGEDPGGPRDRVRGRVGGRRDLEPEARHLRALVLLPQGRAGADPRGRLEDRRPAHQVPPAGRDEGAGPRRGAGLRAPRRVPGLRAGARAARQGLAPAGLRGAEGTAREGGPLRPGAQAPAPDAAAAHRGRDLAHRGGPARHPARPALALRGPRGARLPRARAGRGRRGRDRAGDPRAQPHRRPRRDRPRPRGRQPRGPVGLQRGGGGPGDRGLPRPHDLGGGPRDRLHDRRLRGRPARPHALGRRRAGGAGQGGAAGAGRRPRGAARRGPAPAPGAGARARGGRGRAPGVRGGEGPRPREGPARGRAGAPRARRASSAASSAGASTRGACASGWRPSGSTGRSRPAASASSASPTGCDALFRKGAEGRRAALSRLAASLDGLSPLAVLGRGYALVWDEAAARLLRDAAEVEAGQGLRIRLHRGALRATVVSRETE